MKNDFSALDALIGPQLRSDQRESVTHLEVSLYGGAYNTQPSALTDLGSINGELHAVGLSGNCAPGTALLVAPEEYRAELFRLVSEPSSVRRAMAMIYNPSTKTAGFGSTTRDRDRRVHLVRPGQVLRWSEPFDTGLVYWLHTAFQTSDIAADDANYATLFGSQSPTIVAYKKSAIAPAALPYGKVPLIIDDQAIPTADPTTSGDADAHDIPLGATHLLLMFRDNSASATGITAGESQEFKVLWLMPDTTWHHDAADDLIPSGRGQIDTDHSFEIYEIPPGAIRVHVTDLQTVTTDAMYLMLAFEDRTGTKWGLQ